MKHIDTKGFTLIELMVTVAVLGILAIVAIPAYQDYTIRAQVSEGISLSSGAKVSISEFYANKGIMPTDSSEAGYGGASGKYVKSVEIDEDGNIEVIYSSYANSLISDKALFLTGTDVNDNGVLTWTCQSEISSKYLPTSCAFEESTNTGGSEGVDNGGNGDGDGDTDPVIPEPEPEPEPEFTWQDAIDAFPGRAEDAFLLTDDISKCTNPSECPIITTRYNFQDWSDKEAAIDLYIPRTSGSGTDHHIIKPTGIDENGKLVYKIDSDITMGDDQLSTVKMGKDNKFEFYKKDPNDPTKEILINGAWGSDLMG